jgi:hypothetical protein
MLTANGLEITDMANAAIFANYAQPIRSVQDYTNEAERGEYLQGQNAIQRATLLDRQNAQRVSAEQKNALTNLLSGANGEDDVINRLLGSGNPGLITQGSALDLARQKRAKEKADIGKVGADTAKVTGETADAALKRYQGMLPYIDTPQAAARWLQAQYNDPAAGQILNGIRPFEEAVTSIPSDPQQFQQWRTQAGIGMEKVAQFAKERELAKLQSDTSIATNAATNATSRANNEATNATTRRGQTLIDKRASERLDFDKGVGVADAGGPSQVGLVKQFGKASPGYRWKQDGSQEAIPGGPADIKAGEVGAKREKSQQAALAQADRIITTVDSALKKVGYSTSGVGSVVAGVPGTTARDLKSELETVKANLGFAELQAMREASPTGGALGAIAVQELTALQSTVASLDQGQSPAQLQQSLKKIRGHLQKLKEVNGGSTGGATASFDAATDGWKVEKQ